MNTKFLLWVVFFILSFSLSSCGFRIKGSSQTQDANSSQSKLSEIRIIAPTSSTVGKQLRQKFTNQTNNSDANFFINIIDERLENKVISYGNNSEPNGYEIKIALRYEIFNMKDGVKNILFSEKIDNLDYLFVEDGDSQSEINQEKMKDLVNLIANQLSQKVHTQAMNQLNKD